MTETLTAEEIEALKAFDARCVEDRVFAIENLLRIPNKDGNEIPFKLWPLQKKVMKYYYKALEMPGKSTLWIAKFRQGGITFLGCGDRLVESRLYENQQSLFLIKNDEDTEPLFERVQFMAKSLPEEYQGLPQKNQAKYLKYDDTKSGLRILTAGASIEVTSKKGRSATVSSLWVTEAAYIKYLQALIKSARGSIVPNGVMVFESTGNGPYGVFHDKCRTIQRHGKELESNVWQFNNDFLLFLPFYEHPEYKTKAPDDFEPQSDWEEEMFEMGIEPDAIYYRRLEEIANRTDENAESGIDFVNHELPYKLDNCFYDVGNQYFDLNVIKQIEAYSEVTLKEPIEFGLLRIPHKGVELILPDKKNKNSVLLWDQPREGWENRYCLFADCAEGLPQSDNDVIYVLDRITREIVAACRGKHGAAIQSEQMISLGFYFGNAWIGWDRTGIGSDRLPYLIAEKYPKLFSTKDVENPLLETEYLGIKWGSDNRPKALGMLKHYWQSGFWKIGDKHAYKEAHAFGYEKDKTTGKLKSPKALGSETDDDILTLAGLAYMEAFLPPPKQVIKTTDHTPKNVIQKKLNRALRRGVDTPRALTGMGNHG